MAVNSSGKVFGTSSDTTSSVTAKAKTASVKPSRRVTSAPRQRKWGSPPTLVEVRCLRIISVRLFHRIDAIRIERKVFFDGGDRWVRRFVSPDGILGATATGRYAEVGRLTFVGTVGRVRGAFEECHVHVAARNVAHHRISGFTQVQGRARIRDDATAD